ncbi:tRNA (adenosine(37)-N6)-threonylcarbamoyltransferase complex ATPase subunit type 1 TsaE [candidate division WWE3 bacterium]|nr:tRNA (adenosine(37)-N6)-threonylcarbamoyltransferase complex ATPase subunit type 1 TsaE [candidate division WWE3 bacterium]
MEVLTHSPDETKKLAGRMIKSLKIPAVLALCGELGSGKTTFVQGFVSELGVKDKVLSPTFVLARRYKVNDPTVGINVVNHIDLYRIKNRGEALNIGLESMFLEEGSVTLIEWPEVVEGILPENAKRVKFELVDGTTRRIYV